jgi:hypothetical protein
MIEFETPQSMRWNLDRQEVRFAARLAQRVVLCRVSGEAIEAHLVIKGSNEAPLQAARRNFDKLFGLARQAITQGRFEGDSSILLSDIDFQVRTAFDA